MSNLFHQNEALGNTARVFNKTNRAKIKSSHVLLIFQSFIFVFCTFLLGIAMVKYCAVAVCRNGTHRPNLTYFAFTEDNTRRRKCKRADKKFKSLSIRGSAPYIFKKTDMTVSDSGRKSVTGYPTLFDPTSTKTTQVLDRERIDTRSVKPGVLIKALPRRNVVLKSLISGMMQRIVRESLST